MSLPCKNAKARAEVLGNLEICRAFEFRGRELNGTHPGEDEGTELVAHEVKGEQIPLVLNASQVVGLYPPLLMARAAQLLVFKGDFQGAQHRFAQTLEQGDIRLG